MLITPEYYRQVLLKLREQAYPQEYLCKRLEYARELIERFYYLDLDINAMAKEASFSKFHFIRLFKALHGKTPNQYLQEARMEKARQLLRLCKPVADTCYEVGFTSVSTFCALFKKYTGTSPSAFRQQFVDRNTSVVIAPIVYGPCAFAAKEFA
jgi:AraC-like DNA-binding protein